MIKKIAAFSIGSLFLVAPLVSSADTMSDLQARIQSMLSQIQSLQTLVNQNNVTTQHSSLSDDEDAVTTNAGIYCPRLFNTLQRGNSDSATGGQVSELQSFLTDYYHLNENVIMGGFYGQLTQSYVSRFQQEHGLPPLGLVGARTRAVITSVCGATAPTTPPPPSTAAARSATVDAHEAFHSGTFTLSGSAQNVSTVVVALIPYPSYQGSTAFDVINSGTSIANGVFVGSATVSSGRWSENFVGIPNGTYTLVVYDLTTHFILVSSGTVVVGADMTPPPPPSNLMPGCPIFQQPLCPNGTLVSQGLDVNGCAFPAKCVPNVVPPPPPTPTPPPPPPTSQQCPVYQLPLCPAGQHLAVGVPTLNAQGCVVPAYTCTADPVSTEGMGAGYPTLVPTCTLGAHTTTIADMGACVSWCRNARLGAGLINDRGTTEGMAGSGSCVFRSSTGVSTIVAEASSPSANLASALTALEAALQQMLATLRQ